MAESKVNLSLWNLLFQKLVWISIEICHSELDRPSSCNLRGLGFTNCQLLGLFVFCSPFNFMGILWFSCSQYLILTFPSTSSTLQLNSTDICDSSFLSCRLHLSVLLCCGNPHTLPLDSIPPHFLHEWGMRLSPVLPTVFLLLILLAEKAQDFQRAGAGVLEVLTSLQQETKGRRSWKLCSPSADKIWKLLVFVPHLSAAPVPNGLDDTVISQSHCELVPAPWNDIYQTCW